MSNPPWQVVWFHPPSTLPTDGSEVFLMLSGGPFGAMAMATYTTQENNPRGIKDPDTGVTCWIEAWSPKDRSAADDAA